jgi:SPP1 family phage portal protein
MIVRTAAPTNAKELESVLEEFKPERDHIIKLKKQYIADQKILHRETTGTDKPDKRLVNNFPGYITTVHTGYFIGQPVKYASEDAKLLEAVTKIHEYNDEQEHNYELSKAASKCGVGKELYYIDEDKQCRIAQTEPEDTIIIRDATIARNIVGAVRTWVDENDIIHATVYDETNETTYTGTTAKSTTMKLEIEATPHNFSDVPVSEFQNNREEVGDYEKVLSLIDAYDESESETANDFAYFTDAYLVLAGASGTTPEQIASMKNNRVLALPDGATAEWLTKNIQDEASENQKNRLEADIHKFSFTPDMSDESFAGNTSGEAMKYKLWGLEQMAVQKERCFKKGLQRRFELICGWLNLKGATYNYRDINMDFTRNMPKIVSDMADVVQKLIGIVPTELLYKLLPFIENVDEAIAMLEAEKTTDLSKYETTQTDTIKEVETDVGTTGQTDAEA